MAIANRRAITLIESLIVIGVIVIGICLFLPATRRVQNASERAKCQNNIKEMMLALHNAESNCDSRLPMQPHFPTGCVSYEGNRIAVSEEKLSWMVSILPYLGEDKANGLFNLKAGYNDSQNQKGARTKISRFLCPLLLDGFVDLTQLTHYVAMAGVGIDSASWPAKTPGIGFMGYDRLTSLEGDVTDGLSNTIAIMETSQLNGSWAQGGPTTVRGFDPQSKIYDKEATSWKGHNSSGFMVGLGDGSVRYIRSSISPKALAAAITIAGGEKTEID
jgi:hypothetical protein